MPNEPPRFEDNAPLAPSRAAEILRLVREAMRLLSHQAWGKPPAREKLAAIETLRRVDEILGDASPDAVTILAAAFAFLRKVERREPVSVALMVDFAVAVRGLSFSELAEQVIDAPNNKTRLTLAARLAEAVKNAFTSQVVGAPFSPNESLDPKKDASGLPGRPKKRAVP